MKDKLAKTLGLAYISKNLVLGQDNINKLNFNKLKVVIYQSDLSEKYLSFLKKVNTEREIKYIEVEEGFLAETLGIKNAKICALTNKAFTKKVLEMSGE